VRKNVRRATVVLALTPLICVPMTVASFASGLRDGGTTTTTTIPAPPGDSSAVAAEVNGIIAIGKTKAHAGSDGGSSSADGLDLLGQRIAGGDQHGVGSSGGNLIGTGDTPLGDAEVAPWSNKVTGDDGGYQAMAEAALAHVNLADVVELWLLHSKSGASWTPDQSTGDAESDGAEVSALDMLDVKVLHSEAHSNGTSKSDLLVINGTEIGSSDDANGMCQIDATPLIDLICLTANGGTSAETGVTSSDGTVVTVDVGDGSLIGTVSGSTSQGGHGQPVSPPREVHHQPQGGDQSGGGQVPAVRSPQGSLPFTGTDAARATAFAVALAALGGAMTAFGRRRRSTFAF
jgi:hypothetical protein